LTITHPAEPSWYEPAPLPGDSWRAVNLLDHDAHPEPAPSIGGCVYAGKRHLLSGESETGKSWLALAWCHEELGKGNPVVYIDHEMGRSMTLERLRVLGVPDRWIPSFRYVDPTEPALLALEQIEELVEDATLVIIDATIGSLSLHALDENSTTDIERWYQRVVDPLRSSGAAVVVLDHVTKNAETRGKYAIGSQRKVGASDVHLSCECVKPFGRNAIGIAKVTVKKDRPGHLARPTLGTFTLDPAGIPTTFTWTPYNESQTQDEEGHFRPTVLMERVSEYLAANSPASKRDIENGVTGKREYVRAATEALIREGYVRTEPGTRKGSPSIEHHLVSLFTDDKTGDSDYRPTIAPPENPRNLSFEASEEGAPPRPTIAPLSPRAIDKNPRPLAPPLQGGEGQGEGDEQQTFGPSPLTENCPACSSSIAADPWSTAGGTYCCHDCARGEACACKYLTSSDKP
jgi:hypothetical protein